MANIVFPKKQINLHIYSVKLPFRSEKEIYILHRTMQDVNSDLIEQEYARKLRVEHTAHIHVIWVDDKRREYWGKDPWEMYLQKLIR